MLQCPRCGSLRFRLKGEVRLDVVIRIDCLGADDVHIEQEWMEEPPDDLDVYEEGIECLACHGWCSQSEARETFEQATAAEAPDSQQIGLFPEND